MAGPDPQPGITQLLATWSSGDRTALDRLLPQLYAELRQLARRELAREHPGHTLDSVALVHEAYLKLAHQNDLRYQSRAHFFAVAARAMRTLLVDHARARTAQKRGGGGVLVTLDRVAEAIPDGRAEHLLALDEALSRLAEIDEEAARTVECRYFAGLTTEEVATALGLSVATVRRRWAYAKAWLRRELQGTG